MTKIKFGTDGWRAIIAEEFTTENVARVTEATAKWLLTNFDKPSVVIGHDCRFAGELFAETAARVFIKHGVKVFLAKGFVSTPMVSLGNVNYKSNLGVVVTASHNPPEYNGYKLKGSYGGPLLPDKIEEIEALIPDKQDLSYKQVEFSQAEAAGQLVWVDLEDDYCLHVEKHFDLDAIRNSKFEFAYDAMFGAGQQVIRRLLPDITMLHCEYNPSFEGQAPEPIARNLTEFSEMINLAGNIDCGLATDGDADRIGLFDKDGSFVDSHHIILLLIHYLKKYKGFDGKVCTAFSSTVKIARLCEYYGLPLEIVKIGFKYIAGIMIKEDVLLGGEESGGIAIKGHIPERDGIWMGLVIWEFMAKSGKTLRELIDEVYAITGAFAFERNDVHLKETLKQQIIQTCASGGYNSFGPYKVQRLDDLDGFKFFLSDDSWVMIRASGTEPLLRIYAEAATKEETLRILQETRKVLGV
ncbi:MAG: phosphoglucomutase/phosphomannomutase family protein [Bacteroidia bacterium]|nr:phosphoglucomutase/phosphomannomutase family protein [Bacteroidia bacterium]MCC6768837.1 phosphoglucomutase/phosphomannomutase family protein [Bacteroidia bacterium]